jgi:hypothetical protein
MDKNRRRSFKRGYAVLKKMGREKLMLKQEADRKKGKNLDKPLLV